MFFISMGGGDKKEAVATPAPPRFSVYLLPSFSIPFRRQRSSSSVTSYTNPPRENSTPSLGSSPTDSVLSSSIESPLTPPTPSYFSPSFMKDGCPTSAEPLHTPKLLKIQPDTLRCSTCSADFAFSSQIVSKGFTGRYGRAYLVSAPDSINKEGNSGKLINIVVGKPESRPLVTGIHVVADITCAVCRAKVGWKYIDAKEESQKYKIGKFILETQKVADFSSWEHVYDIPEQEDESKQFTTADGDDVVIFNSDDEDECEDVFTGIWDPVIAAQRRSRKFNRRQKQTSE